MNRSSLDLIDGELAERVRSTNVDRLRSAVLSVCRLALEMTDLTEPAVLRGMEALEGGRYGDTKLLSEVVKVQRKLDRRQERLKLQGQKGLVDGTAYKTVFRL